MHFFLPAYNRGVDATDWIVRLAAGDDDAVDALRRLVRKRLGASLGRRYGVSDADLEDFTQDACVRILASLDTFRGDARFTTWATAVAVRVALTELRKRRWTAERTSERLAELARPDDAAPRVERAELFDALHAAIAKLTPRQRQVVLGELDGIPQVRLAEALDVAPNAIYKMSHDARRKLRTALEGAGFDASTIRATLEANRC